MMMFCCLRNCFDGFGFAATQTPKREPNPIALDTSYMDKDVRRVLLIAYYYQDRTSAFTAFKIALKNATFSRHNNVYGYCQIDAGHEVVIVKNGLRVCGRGGALTNAPLAQSKSYFEVKIQQGGIWAIGLATRSTDLNITIGGNDTESWALNSDGIIRHNQQEVQKVQSAVQEGDIIGVSYDHVELNFYLNGKSVDAPVMGIKGTIYPVLYVDDGAILDLILDNFAHSPPPGFEKIMLEQSLL